MNIWTRILLRVTNLAAVLALAAAAANALAGDFYEKEGAAIRGYDPVAYFTDKNWPVVQKQTKVIE